MLCFVLVVVLITARDTADVLIVFVGAFVGAFDNAACPCASSHCCCMILAVDFSLFPVSLSNFLARCFSGADTHQEILLMS